MALAALGMVIPSGSASVAHFRDEVLSQGPDVYRTAEYWKQALDVVELSGQLGDTQKVIAEYWADGSTTVTPAGTLECLRARRFATRRAHSR